MDAQERTTRAPIFTAAFVNILLADLMIRTCTFMLIALVPLYVLDRGYSATVAGLTTTLYTGAALVVRPLSGRLVDLRGRYAVMLAGSAVYCVATGCYLFVVPIWLLLGVRAVQGIGFSFNGTALMTMATDVIPPARMSEGIGYLGLSQTLAQAFAPGLALLIKNAFGYRVAFMTLCVFALLNFLARFPLRAVERRQRGGVGESGTADSSGADSGDVPVGADCVGDADPGDTRARADRLGADRVGADCVGDADPGDIRARADRLGAGHADGTNATLKPSNAAFSPSGSVEGRVCPVEAPTPWWRHLIDRDALRPAAVMFLVMVAVTAVITFLVAYAVGRGIANPAGFFTAAAVAVAAARLTVGRAQARFGVTWVVGPGLLLLTAGMLVIWAASGLGALLAAAVLYGLGLGAVQPALNPLAVIGTTRRTRGVANSTFFMSMDLAQAVGGVSLGGLASWLGMGPVFAICAGVTGLAFVVFVAMRPGRVWPAARARGGA